MDPKVKPEDNLIQLAKDYRITFNSEVGKRVLKDLELRSSFKYPTFSIHNPDPYVTVFQEGNRAMYLSIITMMDLDLEKVKAQRNEDETND